MKNYSSRREAIRRALMSVTTHPTAAEVFEMVRKEIPNISLGTVYRNLSQLADEQRILRVSTGEGAERYDATTENHYHLVCTACGCVTDLEIAQVEGLDELCVQASGAAVYRHSLIYYGTCAPCLKTQS